MLADEIREELILELGLTNIAEQNLLAIKVDNAIMAVKAARNYSPSHSNEFIDIDILQYRQNIHDLALYDFNQVGAEGQIAHNENAINRTWKSRSECLRGIVPFARVI